MRETNLKNSDGELLKRFLLGFVSGGDARRIEKRFMRDDDFFKEIEAVEDELFYDYAQNLLAGTEKKAFEEKFLNSKEGSEKLLNAKILLEATGNSAQAGKKDGVSASLLSTLKSFFDKTGRIRFTAAASAAVAAVIFFIIGAGWFFNLSRESEDNFARRTNVAKDAANASTDISEKQTQVETALKNTDENNSNKNYNSESELEREIFDKPQENSSDQTLTPRKDSPENKIKKTIPPTGKKTEQNRKIRQRNSILAIVLSANGSKTVRGGGGGIGRMKTVKLAPEMKFLRVTLNFALRENYEKFSARLYSINDGRQIWTSTPLETFTENGKKSLRFDIPTEFLERNDYEISLFGTNKRSDSEEIESFYFRIEE